MSVAQRKYDRADEIPDEAIIEAFAQVNSVKFSARTFNHIPYRSIGIGDLGWWLSLTRVLPLLGITPQMLKPVFSVPNRVLPENIETYEQLGDFPLSEKPFQKLAEILGKSIQVWREDGSTGDHYYLFTAHPDGNVTRDSALSRVSAVRQFRILAAQERFKGWPLVDTPEIGVEIPYFGATLHYNLQTGNGVEGYTSILRRSGWAVVFGVTKDRQVITLCQWKPGVNQASWELPPGGIGKLDSQASYQEIRQKTYEAYLRETGYGNGNWQYLGHVGIETGKYRGTRPDDHGFKAHLFMATDLEMLGTSRAPNPNEIIETLLVPIDEFPQVLDSGYFVEESAEPCSYRALLKLGLLRWSLTQ